MFLLRPETRSTKYSTLVYYDPDTTNEKGRVNLGEAIVELNMKAATDFKNDAKNNMLFEEGFDDAVGIDITGKVPRDVSKTITMVLSFEESKNLASIIRGYKIGVTKNARQINPDFRWQTRFYDHIIRDDQSFQKISEYIQNNPTNWQDDKFHNSEP